MKNWEKYFADMNKGRVDSNSTFGVDAVTKETSWTGIKGWSIGEWGSLASIIGIGLWVLDKTFLKTPTLKKKYLRKKK